MVQSGDDFNAVRIALASPDQIKMWSYGEVTKPETINYRTLRPEKDGLFCERIFGPTKDWECYCGKYKKIRYKGVICDRCGVEVARAKVRRERMGHISLAAPVAHIWMSKGIPSRLGLLLDLSPRNLERVLYFAQYLVTEVDEPLRHAAIEDLERDLEEALTRLDLELEEKVQEVQASGGGEGDEDGEAERIRSTQEGLKLTFEQAKETVQNDIDTTITGLEELQVGMLLTESRYRELRDSFPEVFKAGMGAEAVLRVLQDYDLDHMREDLQGQIRSTSGQRRKKAIKTLRIVDALRESGNKPEWMVMTSLPVLPPELRPMVQLDGGRFATSDLNDLYRRVINRNNRLKRLIELQAPEIIVRNEKRMLQEAVDALIDNGRRGRPVSGSHNHKLKSLSDLLRGKQGRFRQNLLGKRVDYSGRSVITVGPNLELHQCGLPRRMALELFKPFVMNRLVINGYAHNIKSAKRLAESARPEVWDILEDIVRERPVLLNRAPTLHRLGNPGVPADPGRRRGHQGASPGLPGLQRRLRRRPDGGPRAALQGRRPGSQEGDAQLLQHAVAQLRRADSRAHAGHSVRLLLPHGWSWRGRGGEGRKFASFEDARLAYEMGSIDLRAKVQVRHSGGGNGSGWMDTTVGRIIFNDVLPEGMEFRNEEQGKDSLKEITAECFQSFGNEETLRVLDAIKNLGFQYASKSGTTIAINDIEVPPKKDEIVEDAENSVAELENQYLDGLITEEERHRNSVEIWTRANDDLTKVIEDNMANYGGIYLMAVSGAKGNIAQIKQMAGMRGLMASSKGHIIDRPIKSSFREGLSVLEYFISTHGSRKGLSDTALRTADSGYLTRRLIDVAQEVTITVDDCEAATGFWMENEPDDPLATPFADRLKSRTLAQPIADPETGEIIADAGDAMDEALAGRIAEVGVDGALVRSPLACEAERGLCKNCYGDSLATGARVMQGEAVGIIAAQSIGEPGTQLTMRTFHTGGIAGEDITSGLPRVVELFEARSPKGEAVLSEIDGIASIVEETDAEGRIARRSVVVDSVEEYSDEYRLPEGHRPLFNDGDTVNIGDPLAEADDAQGEDGEAVAVQMAELTARVAGTASVGDGSITISWEEKEEREYPVSAAATITVSDGDRVTAGDALTAGPKSPQQILRILGREAVQRYLIGEVQKVYRSQGVTIHDKHIEVVVRQMMRKVSIDSPGDTDHLPGEYVGREKYEETNASVLAEGGEPATASPVLLGITRASLNMESFLAAASFQETTRVLTESAINGSVDNLRGLKENVIIGRLIPARFDISEEGRERLGLDEGSHLEPVGALATPLAGGDMHDAPNWEDVPDEDLPRL